jgi:hypothetical protein
VAAAGADLATVQSGFAEFAAAYSELPLYSAVSRAVAADPACAALLLAAGPGQDRPVLWFAALHDLVLREPGLPAARWYASVVGRDRLPAGDPWPDVRSTVLARQDELRAVIASHTTQTNEVNRCAYLVPALALAVADRPEQPVVLIEMGASAGLLLGLDRYDIELIGPRGVVTLGDPMSPVRCSGEDRSDPLLGDRPALTVPPVVGRAGLDHHPVDLADAVSVRWLEACLWPDVPGRVERFRSAVQLLSGTPNPVVRGDMVADLPAVMAAARAAAPPEGHLVVFSSWALTYVARERRPAVAAALATVAADGRPLTWLTAEPLGCMPGVEAPEERPEGRGQTTVLAARRWRDGVEEPPVVLGTAHPHGQWVAL